MKWIGDVAEDATVHIFFTTHDASGGAVAPSSAFEAADVDIYKNNSATQKATTNGLTMTSPFDGTAGLHLLVIDTSNDTGDAGFWATGSDYTVVLTPDETVDSQTVVSVLAQFSIENRFTNVAKISGDATAADNLELMFNGTGYTDSTAPASRAQVDGIGAASGGSLNFANEADNVDSAIKSISFDGVETSGTNASVNFEDGTFHQIDDATNNIDIVYQFDVGGGRTAVELTWKGRLTGTNDEMTIQAYNGTGWDTLKTVSGQSNSAPTSSADNATETIPLLSTHTGTGGDLGKVFIRLECASQSNPTLYTDQLLVAAVNIGQSIGYADGAVWLDTNASNTNTESFVDGVADNPVSTIAAAKTIADAVGIKRIRVLAGSDFTLSADMSNFTVIGANYTMDLGNQQTSGMFIEGATIDGGTSSATNPVIFSKCIFDTSVTLPPCVFRKCFWGAATITLLAGDYFVNGCIDRGTGLTTPTFDFVSAGNTTLNVHMWSGGITVDNMGDSGTDAVVVSGSGFRFIGAASNTGGTVTLLGTGDEPSDSSGNLTITRTGFVSNAEINAQADTALSDYDAPTKAELDSGLAALNDPTAAAIATAVMASSIENSLDVTEVMRVMLSAMAGKVSGAATTSMAFRDTADSKDRISATVDADGNRTAVTLDAS